MNEKGMLCLFAVVTALRTIGYSGAPPAKGSEQLTVKVKSIDVTRFPQITSYIVVRDASGKFMPTLSRSECKPRFTDINTHQEISPADFSFSTFSKDGKSLTTLLLVDHSGSMKRAIPDCRRAVKAFTSELAPQDSVGLITFGTVRRRLLSPTSDRNKIEAAVVRIRTTSQNTAINDAVYDAVADLTAARGDKKAIVLLSDGEENHSRRSLDDAIAHARREGILVYTVGLGREVDPKYLSKLAAKTGGEFNRVMEPGELSQLYRKIAATLRNEYVLSFPSGRGLEAKTWYALKVSIHHGSQAGEGERRMLTDPHPAIWDPGAATTASPPAAALQAMVAVVVAVVLCCALLVVNTSTRRSRK